MLDNLIYEVKAVMFEQLVYLELSTTREDDTYNRVLWAKIEKDLDTTNFDRALSILQGGKGLPLLYGYKQGYQIVQSYLDLHPNVKVEQ